jgi:hypothetical protein
MLDPVEAAFREWTQRRDPLAARISLFEHVRDIPYAVIPNIRNCESGPSELLKGMRGSCTPKHFLLGRLFEMLGLKIRYATFPFSWDDPDIRYPDEIRELARSLPTEYHLALRVLIEGKWRLVDATWDLPLRSAGFPVNESWDGISYTLLAVKPIEEIENLDARDRDSTVKARKSAWTEDDRAREGLFIARLNRWLESLRTA